MFQATWRCSYARPVEQYSFLTRRVFVGGCRESAVSHPEHPASLESPQSSCEESPSTSRHCYGGWATLPNPIPPGTLFKGPIHLIYKCETKEGSVVPVMRLDVWSPCGARLRCIGVGGVCSPLASFLQWPALVVWRGEKPIVVSTLKSARDGRIGCLQ